MSEKQIKFRKPIVLSLKKKTKKRRYSKGLGELQEAERHITKASHRFAKAIEKGLADYRLNSAKSAKQKKDGALRDFIPNSGIATSKAMVEASHIPADLAGAVNNKPMRKRLRRQIKGISRSLRRW